jgi:hypothetical protein
VIHVFLRIHDPRDGVDARKESIDTVSVLGNDRVEVGKIKHGDFGERATHVLSHLAHTQPTQQAREFAPST